MRADRRSVRDWFRDLGPEFLLILLGALLRASMRWTYQASWSYDGPDHLEYVRWIADHAGRLPPVNALRESFHPPLFYAMAAWLVRHGVSERNLLWLPIGCGVLRLILFAVGLRWYVRSRLAQLAALALAVVLPVSVHIDGMTYPEPLSCLLATAAMLFIPRAFRAQGARRLAFAVGVGVLLGLQLLTKISGAVSIAGVGLVAAFELFRSPAASVPRRVLRAVPWLAVVLVPVLLTGWYFGRNIKQYRTPFLTSFDLSERGPMLEFEKVPLIDRRKLGFFIGWEPTIFGAPYYSVASFPYPRFWSVAVASTFVDYYNFSFSGIPPLVPSTHSFNSRPVSARLLNFSRASMAGGTAIAFCCVIGWAAALLHTWRRRDWGRHALLVIAALAVAGVLQFCVKYPRDEFGVIKAGYMLFGTAPLAATFGLVFDWAARARRRRPLLIGLGISLYLVASYSIYCRFRISILPF